VQQITGKEFVKCRPDWLKINATAARLELDMYNDELKLAIEYNGEQHYRPIGYFGGEDQFFKQVTTDLYKAKLCYEHGVQLITIPYHIAQRDLYTYLEDQIDHHGIVCFPVVDFMPSPPPLPSHSLKRSVVRVKILAGHRSPSVPPLCKKKPTITIRRHHAQDIKQEQFKEKVESRGGKVIDGLYVNKKSEFALECQLGHHWNCKAGKILSGSWCHICSRQRNDDVETKQKISVGLREYYTTEKGHQTTAVAHAKRSVTMAKAKQEFRVNLTELDCKRCNQTLPLDSFGIKSDAKSGRQPYCKKCQYEYKQKWKANKIYR